MTKLTFRKFWVLLLPFLLFSCKDRFEEHFEVPKWLKGSAWEVLDADPDYSLFMEAAEQAGYRPILEGKNLVTVMAPKNQAFKAYLEANGYSSIEDISADHLESLIGFHLLYYSYTTEKFLNFRPEGDLATEEDKAKNAGTYYKHRTRSKDPVSLIYSDSAKRDMPVYHQERYIPVYSSLFFQTKNIDAKSNYEYFYPKSTWTAGTDGFNVSNASVESYQTLADNGYIYTINTVLDPLNTIYDELKESQNYDQFAQLFDKFQVFSYAANYSSNYGAALGYDSLYLYQFEDLPDIALTWASTSYFNFSDNASKGKSVFAPSNQALSAFYQDYWGNNSGYSSLNEVDNVALSYLIKQHAYDNAIIFPEEITQGMVTDTYGDDISIDPATVAADARIMCVNGVIYGIDDVLVPKYYTSIMGPAFRYADRLSFLYALDYSGVMSTYSSDISNYAMFIPDTIGMELSGYRINFYSGTNRQYLQYEPEGDPVNVPASVAQDIVRMHTVQITEKINPAATQVLETQTPFNYLFIKNNQITTNSLFNQQLSPEYSGSPYTPFTEILNNGKSWDNGQAFLYDGAEIFSSVNQVLKSVLGSSNDYRYEYYPFAALLRAAGMITDNSLPFLMGSTRFVAFIPTGDAIKKALENDKIPGVKGGKFDDDNLLEADILDEEELEAYLKNYFLTSSLNVISDYPYIGSSFTSGIYQNENQQTLIYSCTANSMSVNSVNVIPDYDLFPFVYTDGCFHFIESVF